MEKTIYDRLIQEIPNDLVVTDCLVGLAWTLVKSNTVGISMTPSGFPGKIKFNKSIKSMNLRELAQKVKSWNFYEAGLGLAAINSYINDKRKITEIFNINLDQQQHGNVFTYMLPELKGKKVAVIGHFPDLELLSKKCKLSILERKPQQGDFPDSACEYILPEQDYVFITGCTIINKTLPRLLQLSKNAKVILVGPSVPVTPLLFNYGIDVLAGSIATDFKKLWDVVKVGGVREIFKQSTKMVILTKDNLKRGIFDGTNRQKRELFRRKAYI